MVIKALVKTNTLSRSAQQRRMTLSELASSKWQFIASGTAVRNSASMLTSVKM
jgi:hypothetical protein